MRNSLRLWSENAASCSTTWNASRPPKLRTIGLWDRGIAASLDLIEGLIEASQLPLPQAMTRHEALWDAYRHGNPWYAAPLEFTQLSGEPMWKALRHRGWHDASLCAARAAVDVERYRSAHGTLPESLDALVPELAEAVPKDPFDGGPLRYRLLDPGYVVYSIGPNLADDEAKTEYGSRTAAMRNGDVAFRVRR